jgi:hypothetical protein
MVVVAGVVVAVAVVTAAAGPVAVVNAAGAATTAAADVEVAAVAGTAANFAGDVLGTVNLAAAAGLYLGSRLMGMDVEMCHPSLK